MFTGHFGYAQANSQGKFYMLNGPQEAAQSQNGPTPGEMSKYQTYKPGHSNSPQIQKPSSQGGQRISNLN